MKNIFILSRKTLFYSLLNPCSFYLHCKCVINAYSFKKDNEISFWKDDKQIVPYVS
jgi:hypothetical protein